MSGQAPQPPHDASPPPPYSTPPALNGGQPATPQTLTASEEAPARAESSDAATVPAAPDNGSRAGIEPSAVTVPLDQVSVEPAPADTGASEATEVVQATAATNGSTGLAPAEARYGATEVTSTPLDAPPPPPPPAPPPPPDASASGDDEPAEPGTMTILEHLEELRERIVKAGLAVVVGMVISGVWLSGRVLEWLIALGLEAGSGLQNINPPAVFFEYMKVTVFTGAALAMPVVIYQVLMFILPALTPKEKRYSYIIVPGSAVCFAAGVAFGYYILLPAGLGFLRGFAGQYVPTNWDISLFLGFVTTMLFWMGVSFQTPLIVFLLTSLGVISAARLSRYRKYAFLVAFVVAAIITPTPDPLTQTLVGLPLYLLFELGLLLSRFVK